MAEQYYSILTNRGKELEAASSASGTPVIIKDFVIGDGNGMAAAPDPAQTALVREVYRHAISKLNVSQEQPNQWVVHLVVPADVGGFTIREVGLLTDAGELYAVANCAAIEKPVTGINVNLQFRLAVNETASIELKVATGDGLFLRQDANLSDLNNIAKALENLGLNLVGNWQAVQANGGKHSTGNHRIYVDWSDVDGKLHITVDATDVGELFTTQNPPTAAQTGAYPMTGGYLNEEVSATVISNLKDGSAGQALYAPMWRSCLKNRGGDMDFKDGASACFRLVEVISNYAFAEILVDGFGIVRSFEFRNDGTIHAPNSVYAGQGFIAPDGNIYGPVWGGYANNWVLAQINALNVAINNQLNSMNADRNNCVRATARGGRQHKVGGDWIADWEAPAGCFMTGMNTNEGGDGRKAGLYFRAMYYYTPNSGWVQAGDIA
ncbi:phage tail protein [Pantoea sp. S62]|uniref:phage tail protein n=1 Tax=Pantoea sp. S62 TaxID=2769342 RepID=UPI001911D568|nr:hypothetical protein [Pantoea sp. S62]